MKPTRILLVLSLLGCRGILDVDQPGRVPVDRLDDHALAEAVVNGAIGDLECAFDAYNAGAALMSDEFDNTLGNIDSENLGTRNIGPTAAVLTATCDINDAAMYVPLQIARFQAEDVVQRLERWTEAQVPTRDSLRALIRAYGGYAYLLLGEGFEHVAFGDGRHLPSDSALSRAEDWFSAALQLNQGADISNLARVGRARTRLDRGNTSGAASDAAVVPPGFELLITRGAQSTRRNNKLFLLQPWITVRAAYRGLTVSGVPDPRVSLTGPITRTDGFVFYSTTKHAMLDAPHRLASYKEAQYILAEAVGGAAAVNIINALRDSLSLPHYAGGTPAGILATVVDERGREFFAEGAIRLNDLVRLNMSWKTGTSPVSGTPYGTTRRLPLPLAETDGVP